MLSPLTKCIVPFLKFSTCYKVLKSLKILAQMLNIQHLALHHQSPHCLTYPSVCMGRIPDCWKEAMIAPIPNSTSKSSILKITDQSPSPLFSQSVNCWRNTTSMDSCTNTYTIIYHQIHNRDFAMVTQQLLLFSQWSRNGSLPLSVAKMYVLRPLIVAQPLIVSPTCLY